MSDDLRSFILVKDWVDVGHAVNSVGHAGAIMMLTWDKTDPIMKEWLDTSFKKVTCKVSESWFERAKREADDWFVVTELSFDKKEVVLVFKPRRDYPKFFNRLRLFK